MYYVKHNSHLHFFVVAATIAAAATAIAADAVLLYLIFRTIRMPVHDPYASLMQTSCLMSCAFAFLIRIKCQPTYKLNSIQFKLIRNEK